MHRHPPDKPSALSLLEGYRVVERQARVWQVYEVALDVPVNADNPFDPAGADLQAAFTAPSGTSITVPGFVSRDHTRKLVDGKKKLTRPATYTGGCASVPARHRPAVG